MIFGEFFYNLVCSINILLLLFIENVIVVDICVQWDHKSSRWVHDGSRVFRRVRKGSHVFTRFYMGSRRFIMCHETYHESLVGDHEWFTRVDMGSRDISQGFSR